MLNVRFRSEIILLKTRNGAYGVKSRFTPTRRLKTAAAAWTNNHRRRRRASLMGPEYSFSNETKVRSYP